MPRTTGVRRISRTKLYMSAVLILSGAFGFGHHSWVRTADLGSMSDAAETAVDLALRCGQSMRSASASQRKKALKDSNAKAGGIDPVTETDVANERLITEGLRARFPGHAIVGEEAVSAAASALQAVDPAVPTWFVDPIDGTQNFVKRLPLSCVSIGLCIGGTPTLGVIFDPWHDELWVGVADGAQPGLAYMNGGHICAADAACTRLQDAIVCTDLGYERSPEGVPRLAGAHAALLDANTFGIRILGSTALSLAWVASGRANAFYSGLATRDCPKPWDWCAGAALGAAAGVSFRRLDGDRKFTFAAPSGLCCAGSPELADELERTLLPVITSSTEHVSSTRRAH